jgi:hypothetical protein
MCGCGECGGWFQPCSVIEARKSPLKRGRVPGHAGEAADGQLVEELLAACVCGGGGGGGQWKIGK